RCATHKVQANCFALQKHGQSMAWGWTGCAHAARQDSKKKGRAGLAVQPKSREETPKVGTPWWAGPGHGAVLDMGGFVLRWNLTPGHPHDLREGCGHLATPVLPNGNA